MGDYISSKERRAIIKHNRREISRLEAELREVGTNAAVMRDPANIVEFDGLKTYFYTETGVVKAVDGASFDVPKGGTVGVVGESGCGKSVMSLSLMRLLQRPHGQITGGAIRLDAPSGTIDVAKTGNGGMGGIRGGVVSMIFQEPMTSLNPVLRIGDQLDEVVALHAPQLIGRGIIKGGGRDDVRRRTIESLEAVSITSPDRVYRMYPHELSGGMRQRVVISMAVACSPQLIIADEPTTALDVTIQAQILDLLRGIKDSYVGTGIMLITHDLGVVAEMADSVVVMYAGRVVERGTARDIYKSPAHPYTVGLMRSKPQPGRKERRLYSIPGRVPNPVSMPDYCYFKDRCEYAGEACSLYPDEFAIGNGHMVSCWRKGDI
ncbi:MAG: ABC transporter ATP-binding protein [Oscillospiraceae bacterium]|nr:ABC transporter ATP-binding protein [Oscillospiraceae bacterium]